METQGFNTQPPEGGCHLLNLPSDASVVSTHSRPKAAAGTLKAKCRLYYGFNTQPPEGGCWTERVSQIERDFVSTHSRPKAAANTNQPKIRRLYVSTHSRPKAAALNTISSVLALFCFNTQPPEGGCQYKHYHPPYIFLFQHTAARRRLPI